MEVFDFQNFVSDRKGNGRRKDPDETQCHVRILELEGDGESALLTRERATERRRSEIANEGVI